MGLSTWAVTMMLGGQEVLIVLVVFVLLFGAKKIPELMRGMGQGVREFKKGIEDVQGEMEREEKKEA